MNRDVFPRKDVSLGFDLMQDEPMVGDRSKKEKRQDGFLESLMAAESYFYVSYIGKDTATNEVLPHRSLWISCSITWNTWPMKMCAIR